MNHNYKQFSLFVILDAYVTKNAIEDFLNKDWEIFKKDYINKRKNKVKSSTKIDNYLNYLNEELDDINGFLDDENNIYFFILNRNRHFFDEILPKYKRRIEWFHSVDRYPFDYDIFLRGLK